MSKTKNIKKHEKALKDYISGMSEKDISMKYNVKISTVRTWKYRYKWDEKNETSVSKKIMINGMTSDQIREELINQLKSLGKYNIQSIIEVEAYIDCIEDYYVYKKDLKDRGHIVEWSNGEQSGLKKNDSAELKFKTSAERRKIITHLGLDNFINVKDDEDETL